MFGFEKLEVWERSIGFAEIVYSVTHGMPVDEKFGIVRQIRRASVSISANLVRGSACKSRKKFARFVVLSIRSLNEVIYQSMIAKSRGFLSREEFHVLYLAAEEQQYMLNQLRRTLQGGK